MNKPINSIVNALKIHTRNDGNFRHKESIYGKNLAKTLVSGHALGLL